MDVTSLQPGTTRAPGEVLLGYCRKLVPVVPEGWADARIRRIGSVSACIAKRPAGWEQRWDFNAAGLYDSPEAADAALMGVAGVEVGGEAEKYRLVAYSFVPVRFDAHGGAVAVPVESVFGQSFPLLTDSPLPALFRFAGYDAVQRGVEPVPGKAQENVLGGGFACSPLSCNGLSSQYDTNELCLLRTWADAAKAAADFARPDGGEPGCYYVFGVYAADA
jgi:hypothetical protein